MSVRHLVLNKRVVAATAIPAAVIASGGMVWASSYSAFSATTASPTNNWTSGTVALSDDDSNTAMFNATNLKPGASGTKCIAVTSTGSLASTVKLYGTSYSTTKDLSSNINLKVEEGTGATSAQLRRLHRWVDCLRRHDDRLRHRQDRLRLRRRHLGPHRWHQPDQVLQGHLHAQPSTPDSAQGGAAALGFTWESQNS